MAQIPSVESKSLSTPDIKLAPRRPLPFNRPIVPIALANAALFSTADQVIHKSSSAQSREHHPLQAIPEAIKLQQHPPGTQPQNHSQPDLVSQISQPKPENSFTAPSAPRPGSSAAFVQLPTQNAVTPGIAISSSFSIAKPNRSAHLASDATGNPSTQDMIYTRNRLNIVSNPNGPSRASTPTTVVCSQSTLHVNSQVTVKEEPTEQALNSAVRALKLDSAPALDLTSTHFQQEQTTIVQTHLPDLLKTFNIPDEKVNPYMRGWQLRRIYEKYKDQNGGKTVRSINATDLALMEYCPLSESTEDEKRFMTEWTTNAKSLGGALGAWRKSIKELGHVARLIEEDDIPASKAKQDKGKGKDVESLEPIQEQNKPDSAVPDSPRVPAKIPLIHPPPAINPPVTKGVVTKRLYHSQAELSPGRRPDLLALTKSQLQVSHANAALSLRPEAEATVRDRGSSSPNVQPLTLNNVASIGRNIIRDIQGYVEQVIPRRNIGPSQPMEAGEMVYPEEVSRASSTAHALSQRQEDVEPALTTEDDAIFTVEDGDLYQFYHALRHSIVPRPGTTRLKQRP
ncbi:hypothetical protein CEP52_016986 [Fusarium oligoseptatum]|uniref:Uncharacterized protein n=1 Tax=Fusarium oligoseptatum TaxID=2604345 RepID=A0A428RXR6_9HYPO|nr:hypothetical protein CEP52_016986 [Fusarium oligoseptatum]